MKFTLTYDGELQSNGGKRVKWDIRQAFSPQLQELWASHNALKAASLERYVPKETYVTVRNHFQSIDDCPQPEKPTIPHTDLCAPIIRGGREFIPLVRDSYNLTCGLKITFLRKEPPGRVYQGGDLDNRIKTLFDALQIPNMDQFVPDEINAGPIYCLTEDDSLITGLEVSTHQLLSRPNASKHEVHLVIEVDVRVSLPTGHNLMFLGG